MLWSRPSSSHYRGTNRGFSRLHWYAQPTVQTVSVLWSAPSSCRYRGGNPSSCRQSQQVVLITLVITTSANPSSSRYRGANPSSSCYRGVNPSSSRYRGSNPGFGNIHGVKITGVAIVVQTGGKPACRNSRTARSLRRVSVLCRHPPRVVIVVQTGVRLPPRVAIVVPTGVRHPPRVAIVVQAVVPTPWCNHSRRNSRRAPDSTRCSCVVTTEVQPLGSTPWCNHSRRNSRRAPDSTRHYCA